MGSTSTHSPRSRFSQMVQDKPLRTSWQRKMRDRQERKLAKDFARHLEEEKEKRRQVGRRLGRAEPGAQGSSQGPAIGWGGRGRLT